jgi:anti-sigma B factor antagonist
MTTVTRPSPKIERTANVTVITFTADAIRDVENVIARELEGHLDGTVKRQLLLDFTNVKYLNSLELGTLITLHKRVHDAGGQLTLFNLDAQLRELFSITRLDTFLAICREDEHPTAEQPPEARG